jgi:hypothetical protein
MNLRPLFVELESVFSGLEGIESCVRNALQKAQTEVSLPSSTAPLPEPLIDVMERIDAHPICKLIAKAPFNWVPPQTSSDPLYAKHSKSKVHIELLGPGGLVNSDEVRLGLYGMMPNAEYGMRTHEAEEVYIMLAGAVDWKLSNAPYKSHFSGDRSYHPSMMPHANRTRELAFMSVYAWHGDLSTESYVYSGIPLE